METRPTIIKVPHTVFESVFESEALSQKCLTLKNALEYGVRHFAEVPHTIIKVPHTVFANVFESEALSRKCLTQCTGRC